MAGAAALVRRPGGHGRHLLPRLGAVRCSHPEPAPPRGDVGQSGRVQRAQLLAAAGRRARAALARLGVLERPRFARSRGRPGPLRGPRPRRRRPARLARPPALASRRHTARADQGLRTLGHRPAHPGDRTGLALAASEHELRALHRPDRRRADGLQRRLVRLLHARHHRVLRRLQRRQGIPAVPLDGSLDARRRTARPQLVGAMPTSAPPRRPAATSPTASRTSGSSSSTTCSRACARAGTMSPRRASS